MARPYGVAPLMEAALATARADAEKAEKSVVAAEIADVIRRSGLTRTEFAAYIGTSASRLSTYLAGAVMPSAALMVRMRRVPELPGSVTGSR